MNNYCIRPDYKPNKLNLTLDDISGQTYWNSDRLKSALYYQYYVYQIAYRLLKEKKLNSVLDMGCGIARKLEAIHKHLPDLEISGIDQNSAIEFCIKNYSYGKWYATDLGKPMFFPEISPDLIICSDVIEHFPDPDILLNYIKLYTKANTLVLISSPERIYLHGMDVDSPSNKNHIREWNFVEFENYMKESRFSVLEHKLCLPAKLNFSKIAYHEIFKRWLKGQKLFYNQYVLLKVS